MNPANAENRPRWGGGQRAIVVAEVALTLALIVGALVTVAALASYLPVRQATRIDPHTALADE